VNGSWRSVKPAIDLVILAKGLRLIAKHAHFWLLQQKLPPAIFGARLAACRHNDYEPVRGHPPRAVLRNERRVQSSGLSVCFRREAYEFLCASGQLGNGEISNCHRVLSRSYIAAWLLLFASLGLAVSFLMRADTAALPLRVFLLGAYAVPGLILGAPSYQVLLTTIMIMTAPDWRCSWR